MSAAIVRQSVRGQSEWMMKATVLKMYSSLFVQKLLMVDRIADKRSSRPGNRSRRSILAPSLFATDGLGCVSMNSPSAPTAMAARAIVSIMSGRPPVTPSVWFGLL